METKYEFNIVNPDLDNLGYVSAVANLKDKHDRSTPSHYHWKILKCRMIIFSNSSIMACPDKNDIKRVHVTFNKVGDVYDKLNSLFLKFSLVQDGGIRKVTSEIFQMCFHYTMMAKISPSWNIIGDNYLINNRDFLVTKVPQDGIQYHISSNDKNTALGIKPIKIHFMRLDEDFKPGEWIRVLPSLNKATIDDCYDSLPSSGSFKSYKDLRRHWKNIHGYRIPEEEGDYCTVQFWRGEPMTYPKLCITRNFPIITPIPKKEERIVLSRFLTCLQSKMSNVLGMPLSLQPGLNEAVQNVTNESFFDTQAVSLCTPTQNQLSIR